MSETVLKDWLKPRVARYQMPAVIDFRDKVWQAYLPGMELPLLL